MNALVVVLVVAGVGFMLISVVGVIRFPDFYTRAHVVAKSETLGIMLVVAGLAVLHLPDRVSIKLVLVLVFALIANPLAIHALAGAARSKETAAAQEGEA